MGASCGASEPALGHPRHGDVRAFTQDHEGAAHNHDCVLSHSHGHGHADALPHEYERYEREHGGGCEHEDESEDESEGGGFSGLLIYDTTMLL